MSACTTALADQLAAAARDARALVDQVAGGSPEWAASPSWLTAHIERLSLGALTGTSRACPHLTSSPSVAWSALWRPGEVWCLRCFQAALLAVRGTAEDEVCDGCRRTARPIFSTITAVGPLLVACGLCGDCRADVRAVTA